jgi:hypothetical protein
MRTVEKIYDHGCMYEFNPPLELPDDIAVSGLEQVLAAYQAYRMALPHMEKEFLRNMELATEGYIKDPITRANVLSGGMSDNPRIMVVFQ